MPCGATGTQMNLFSRLFRVARSYANSIGEWPEHPVCTEYTSVNSLGLFKPLLTLVKDMDGLKPEGGRHC